MSLLNALYLVLLAAVAGYALISRIPSLLHTPMMSGSNFIHGIVLAGAMLALSSASGVIELTIGFVAVMAASANVFGGFLVTDRMLKLFDEKSVPHASFLLTGASRTHELDQIDNPDKQLSDDSSMAKQSAVSPQSKGDE